MQVKVDKLSKLERKMNVTIPGNSVDEKVTVRLNELSKTISLKGFRKGKVPVAIVERKYGKDVRYEVVEKIMRETLFEALSKEKLVPAGTPKVEPKSMEAGKPFEYEALFEIYPDVRVGKYDKIKLTKRTSKITAKDVDDVLEKLRKQHATWKVVDRKSKAGDQLTIDFEGRVKGELFDGGTAEGFKIELGAGRMLADFEKSLLGVKTGDKISAKVKFPKDYHSSDLSGKKAEFAITVHEVAEPELPEFNDELAKTLGMKEGGIDALKKDVRRNLQREAEQESESQFKEALLGEIVKANPLELPKVLIEQEIDRLQKQAKDQMAASSQSAGDLPRDRFEDDARRRVALGLLLNEAIKQADMKADVGAVRKKVEEFAGRYGSPEEVIQWYYADKQRLSEVESLVLEEEILKRICDEAAIAEKQVSYEELMKKGERK